MRRVFILGLASALAACAPGETAAPQRPPEAAAPTPEATAPVPVITPRQFAYEIVATYPHDPEAFTQGLLFEDGKLYESTGRNGASSVRRVALQTGEVEQIRMLPDAYFGEGLASVGDRLVMVTWRSGIGFVFDKETFRPETTFRYAGEGWGLTSDGSVLYMSDGSARLRKLDPETLRPAGRVDVTYEGRPINALNELEWIDGHVWANVWQTDRIVQIDPASGAVTGELDLSALYPQAERRDPFDQVLNGIAHDPETGHFFVTGKLWPTLFEIRLVTE